MIDLVFLTVDEVLQLHEDVLEADGGAEGLRDRGLLESAVNTPQAAFGGERLIADVFEMAAAYLLHIARNHAFVDGNKRTALLACLVFLGLNGYTIDRDVAPLDDLTLSVATGDMTRAEAASALRAVARET